MDNIDKLKMMEGWQVVSVEDWSDSEWAESFKITFSNNMSIIVESSLFQEHNVFNVFWQPVKKEN